jgi:hypothetical protein
MRRLMPSSRASTTLSHCNPFRWPVLQLGCSYLFPAALAPIMRLLPPTCGPCHHHAAPCRYHAAPATIMQPPAAIMLPLPPSCSPLPPFIQPSAAIMQPLPLSCSPLPPSCCPCPPQASLAGLLVCYSFFCSPGPSSPAWSAMAKSGGVPVAARNPPPSAVVNPPTSWWKSARGLPI